MSEFPVVALGQIIGRVKEKIRKSKGLHGTWRSNVNASDLLDWTDGELLDRLDTLRGQLLDAVCALRKHVCDMCMDVASLLEENRKPSPYNVSRAVLIDEKQRQIGDLSKLVQKFVPDDYFATELVKALDGNEANGGSRKRNDGR